MKRIGVFFIVVFLFISSTVIAVNISKERQEISISDSIIISEDLKIIKENGYLRIQSEKYNNFICQPGKPLLPIYHKTYSFPKDVKIKDISLKLGKIKEIQISGKIMPCPDGTPFQISKKELKTKEISEDKDTYSSSDLFPNAWYDYSIRCGLDNNDILTTFVIINFYPFRYSPLNNKLLLMDNAKVDIEFDEPENKKQDSNLEEYDLAIIAPSRFNNELQKLLQHKNKYGMQTLLKTTEEIYNEYQGRDKPEKIKFFIKDAKEKYKITYVLLVGGLKSYIYANDRDDINQGSKHWHIPVRYANIRHSDEKSCISDLYYGDIYRYNETSEEWEFEDWDSNGDNIFANVKYINTDVLDLMPDVYVGRLACRNKIDLKIVINKIINYESTPPDEKPWFRRMIGIGGKTFSIYEEKPDGEWACDLSYEYMDELIDEYIPVYASNNITGGLRPIEEDIISAFSEGAGYILFQGHGNPTGWDTIWADGEYDDHDWCGGISTFKFTKFKNKEKLPVVVVGGCHNGLYNISMIQIILTRQKNPHWYWCYYPSLFCFSWGLCVMPFGGAIASTGCTGYGFDHHGPISHSGGLETNFFYEIGQNNSQTLGCAHSGSIRKYIEENKIRQDEAFCITIYQLFGDPSLRLGGYP